MCHDEDSSIAELEAKAAARAEVHRQTRVREVQKWTEKWLKIENAMTISDKLTTLPTILGADYVT